MKKIILLIIFGLILTAQLCSCQPAGGDGGGTDNPGGEQPPAELNITSGKFKIVVPGKCSDAVFAAAETLFLELRNYTGISLQITRDWLGSGETPDSGAYEILIGRTNRPEGGDIIGALRYNDYYVGIEGNKVIIAGSSDGAVGDAMNYFIKNIIKKQSPPGEGGAEVIMTDSDNYLYSDNYKIKEFTILGEAAENYRIVIPENATISERRCAVLIAEHIRSSYGYEIEITADKASGAGNASPGTYEILVGKTSRTSVSAAGHEYVVEASGTKLQILGGSLYAYLDAVDYFKKNLAPAGNSSVEIKAGDGCRTDVSKNFTGGTENILGKSGELRIMFNNILGNCDTSIYPIPQRNEQLAELYLQYLPDVLGFQECSPNSRSASNIVKLLEGTYTEVTVNVANSNNNNYTPLLYRADVLDVIASGYHLYNDGMNDKSKSITWAVFAVKATGARFAVCSTHFYWTGDAAGNAARLLDAEQLLALTENIITTYGVPVISGGDYNCNISSVPLGNLISGGFANTFNLAKSADDTKTHHAYPEYNKSLGIYDTYTPPSGSYSAAIDHILLRGGGVSVNLFDVVTDLYALLSTDHCPVYIDIDLK